jgi:hypothetical protein
MEAVMENYFVQAIIFLAGILLELYTQTLSPGNQKKALRVVGGLLIAVGLVWMGYRLASVDGVNTPVPDEVVAEESAEPVVLKTPTKKAETIPEAPPLDDSSVWINSHPVGASVYLIPATVSLNDLRVDDIQQANNLIGATPLTLELSAGNYYVLTLFPAELYADNGFELPIYSSPTYRDAFPSDGSFIHSASFSDGEHIKDLSRVYRLYKDAGSAQALISVILPLPESERNQAMPFIYPTLSTVSSLSESYAFTEENVKNAIESNLDQHNLDDVVSANMVNEMLQVLSYTGKVVLETEPARIVIQLNGQAQSNFTITVYQ